MEWLLRSASPDRTSTRSVGATTSLRRGAVRIQGESRLGFRALNHETGVQETAQTAEPVQAAEQQTIPVLEESEAGRLVQAFKSGTMTGAQIERLKPGSALRAEFERLAEVELPATSSETRRALRLMQEAQRQKNAAAVKVPTLDGQDAEAYNLGNENAQGGAADGRGEVSHAGGVSGVAGGTVERVPGSGGLDDSGQPQAAASGADGIHHVYRRFLTPDTAGVPESKGITALELGDATGSPQFFCAGAA